MEAIDKMKELCSEGYKFYLQVSEHTTRILQYENPQGFLHEVNINWDDCDDLLYNLELKNNDSPTKCFGGGK